MKFAILNLVYKKGCMSKKTQEQILKEYEQKSALLLEKMMKILLRAQRKEDDEAYRKTLEKIETYKKENNDRSN